MLRGTSQIKWTPEVDWAREKTEAGELVTSIWDHISSASRNRKASLEKKIRKSNRARPIFSISNNQMAIRSLPLAWACVLQPLCPPFPKKLKIQVCVTNQSSLWHSVFVFTWCSLCLCISPYVQSSSFPKNTRHIGLRPHPSPAWPYLIEFHIQWPCFQIRSYSEVLGIRLLYMNLGAARFNL